MMVILNMLFLAVASIVLYGLFLALWTGVLFIFRVKRRGFYTLLSLPVFLVLLGSWFLWQTRPAAVFKGSFGFAPPPDVMSLQSSHWFLGDSGIVYLRFKASPSTVQRITSQGLRPRASGSPYPTFTNSTPPDWWRPRQSSVNEYIGSGTGLGFSNEEAYLIYDPATGEVWYRFVGID